MGMKLGSRFWSKVEIGRRDDCWNWIGARSASGYGRFNLGSGKGTAYPHRVAYMELVGPLTSIDIIDHLCVNPSCVNPDHLEAVTKRENTRRRSKGATRGQVTNTCINGHEYTPENTYHYRGRHLCNECRRESTRRWRAKRATLTTPEAQ